MLQISELALVSNRVAEKGAHRFDFRYNARHTDDGARALLAVKGTDGKQLTYRDSSDSAA